MSTRLQVLIPPALELRIRKAAARTRVSKGEWVRRAIEQKLESEAESGDASAALDRLSALRGPTGDIESMLREIDRGRS
jgi:predicted DNA-binding protein